MGHNMPATELMEEVRTRALTQQAPQVDVKIHNYKGTQLNIQLAMGKKLTYEERKDVIRGALRALLNRGLTAWSPFDPDRAIADINSPHVAPVEPTTVISILTSVAPAITISNLKAPKLLTLDENDTPVIVIDAKTGTIVS